MVSAERSVVKDKEKDKIHIILDELAKMKLDEIAKSKGLEGYKEKMIGKKKVRPIFQYVDYLLEKNFGFKVIKRGEKYYSRKTERIEMADESISPLSQYIDLLKYKKKKEMEYRHVYSEWLARQEGFKSVKEKEEFDAVELGLTVEEFHGLQARERGYESWAEYQNYLDSIYAIEGTYTNLIPGEDFVEYFRSIKARWTKEHEKFISFCTELWEDSLIPYFEKTNKDEAAVFTDDITLELDKFHKSRPGSLNVYNIDDIAIGMSYCLEEKKVDIILSKNKKSIIFRKRK